jgi:predicted TIM-barrel fold metal-dependent hydrolase
MIIDFHIHHTPYELAKDKISPEETIRTVFKDGAPAYTFHHKLYDLEYQIEVMDKAGIDAAVISSGAGLGSDLEQCKFVNDKLREAERKYPGRIIGLTHVPPLGGKAALDELERGARELGFKGVAMPSIVGDHELDSQGLYPFYEKVNELGQFIFVHPALSQDRYLDFDLGRSSGREFQMCTTTIRLINGGVLDDFPDLQFIISHLGGGIAAILGRIIPYNDKEMWGTADHPRHGKLPQKPFRYYLDNRLLFDTGGFFGDPNAVKCALVELKPDRLVFGTDYPQEIRDEKLIIHLREGIKALGLTPAQAEGIFGNNGKHLVGR